MIPSNRHPPGGCRSAWREFSWCGVRFEAPCDWEAALLGKRYLVLETEHGRVLEMKWGLQRGRFNPQPYLRHLNSQTRRQPDQVLRVEPPGDEWRTVSDRFDLTAFSWQGRDLNGRGAILHCPHCRSATLIQFFYRHTPPSKTVTGRLLKSFEDHPADGWIPWSVFDIRAVLPAEFELKSHRFQPGEFQLIFGARRQRLILFRWSPADVLLARQDFKTFAARMTASPLFSGSEGPPTILESRPARSDLHRSRWTDLLGVIHRQELVRIWHLPKKNRILAVQSFGELSRKPDVFDRICRHYEAL